MVNLGCKNFLNKNFCPTLNISFFFFFLCSINARCHVFELKKRGGGGVGGNKRCMRDCDCRTYIYIYKKWQYWRKKIGFLFYFLRNLISCTHSHQIIISCMSTWSLAPFLCYIYFFNKIKVYFKGMTVPNMQCGPLFIDLLTVSSETTIIYDTETTCSHY